MPKYMHVAEKPSVAKEIAKVMAAIGGGGHPRQTPGRSPYNHIWEFNFRGTPHCFTSVAGHLLEAEFGPQSRGWSSFPLAELFHVNMELKVTERNKGIERTLQELARTCTDIVLWLDCDREGENICFEVLSVVQKVKPRIGVKRARFSALTQRDIQRALDQLVDPDKRASDAVEIRQELDFRVGAAFTRFQTLLFQTYIEPHCATPEADEQVQAMRQHAAQNRGAFNDNNNNNRNPDRRPPYSFGPCQFPCLGFVVAKYWERESFVSEKFWNCQFDYQGAKFTWTRGNLFDRDVVGVLVENMLAEADRDNNNNNNNEIQAKILSINQKPTRKFAPAPLATVELQKIVSQYLRISAERCMDVAEKLYQEGFISYPRTETDSYSFTDEELKNLAAAHDVDDAPWQRFAHEVVDPNSNRYRRPRNGGHDDKAHPPIHPLKFGDVRTGGQNNQVNEQRQKIYELICRHFLATMLPEAEAGETTVSALVAREEFKATGFAVVTRGWLECFTYDRTWMNNRNLPNFEVDQVISPLVNFQVHEGQTQAPSLLSEAQLISEMDNFGIGTDATIASHVTTVQQRGYVISQDNGQRMKPTELGIALAAAYDAIAMGELWRPQLRAQTESAMLDVAQGRAEKQVVMQAFIRHYKERFMKVQQSVDRLIETLRRNLPRNHLNNNNLPRNMMRGGFNNNNLMMMNGNNNNGDDDDDDDNNNGMPEPATGRMLLFLRGNPAAAFHRNINNNNEPDSDSGNDNSNLPAVEVILDQCPACQRGALCLNFRSFVDKTTQKQRNFMCLSCSLKCGATVYFNNLAKPQEFPRVPGPDRPKLRCRCGAVKMEFGFTTHGGPVMGAEPDELMCFRCDSKLRDQNYVKMMRCDPPQQQHDQNNNNSNQRNNNHMMNNGNANTNYQLPQLASERQTARQAGAEKKQREQMINNQIDPNSMQEGSNCPKGCGRKISIKTSRSQKNPGRQYYSCGTKSCGFLGWINDGTL